MLNVHYDKAIGAQSIEMFKGVSGRVVLQKLAEVKTDGRFKAQILDIM